MSSPMCPGETIPNLVMVGAGPGGVINFANQLGTVDLVGDVVGFYAAY